MKIDEIVTIRGMFPNFKSTSMWKMDSSLGTQIRLCCAEFTKVKGQIDMPLNLSSCGFNILKCHAL